MTISSKTSRDGFQWTKASGFQSGIPTLGAIVPTSNIQDNEKTHDVIVIGGGYTGLTALRDLTITGHDVLLLEGRDRIGGRSWSSNIEGYPYEMGGTWVHWFQPYIYREIGRYGLTKDLEISHDYSQGVNGFTLKTPTSEKHFTHAEEAEIMSTAIRKFINVDGNYGRTVIPFPHDPHYNPDSAIYDTMSFADRLVETKDELTPIEYTALEGFLSITSGGLMEDSSFFELLRWWALNNYDMGQLMELSLTYKFRSGQSNFARKFFDEGYATGRLSYCFDTPIAKVEDLGTTTRVTARDGRFFTAKRVICTVPLNVLHEITFDPPLLDGKREVSIEGHCNRVTKVHAEVTNKELRSFSGITWPHNKLVYAFGDGTTPAGNTHIVSFGSSFPDIHLQTDKKIEDAIAAFNEFVPMDVHRIVSHNWHNDEFARGAWEFLKPGQTTKYLDVLRQRQGNVLFASADWAMGWRGFIDGAIEDGGRVAMEVKTELANERVVTFRS